MNDRDLGMDRAITRRDFLNGVSLAIGGSLVADAAGAETVSAETRLTPRPTPIDAGRPFRDVGQAAPGGDHYPPALTGLRGSHPGSYEVAHAMRDGKTWESAEDTREVYDLVVVGAGMSGLAAAYFFRKQNPAARVLVLDNHDDFGGHAKRNEFVVDGRLLVAKGGTTFIAQPWTYTPAGRELLREIGVDYFDKSARRDATLYPSLGLRQAMYFDRESFGVDRLVPGVGGDQPPLGASASAGGRPSPEFLAQTPLPQHVQKELLRLWSEKRDYLAGVSVAEKIRTLQTTSYRDYLLNIVKLQPDVLAYFHPDPPILIGGLTIDTTSAWYFFNHEAPGFDGLGLALARDSIAELDRTRPDPGEPSQFHFPEGNAGIARLIVRSLIPEALAGRTMADAELARLDYARLDEPASLVRIRLSSTAVRVRNLGDPDAASEVEVTYVREGKAYRLRAKGCVLACYNAVIPYLCVELPASQKQALALAVRGVNMLTNVALRNWKAFEKLGVWSVYCPGLSYPGYPDINLLDPVALGGYQPPRRPDEPVVVRSIAGTLRVPGVPPRDQFRAARRALYETTFEAFERRIRTHFARLLGDGGFDPARDIAAITINRWPHGYAMGENMFDPDWGEDEHPWMRARKKFGRITIANSDAGAVHLTQCAFDQAYRAVDELNPRHMGWWQRF